MTDAAFTTAVREAAPAGPVPDGGWSAVYGPLLERAQEEIAFQRERADRAEAEITDLGGRISAVVAAEAGTAKKAERQRIRELADRSGAVCSSDEGTSFYFSALLADTEVSGG